MSHDTCELRHPGGEAFPLSEKNWYVRTPRQVDRGEGGGGAASMADVAGTNGLAVEYLKSLEDVRRHENLWNALFSSSLASPYLSYDWCATALEHFYHRSLLCIAVVRRAGTAIAIVPLEIARERIGIFTLPVLRFALEGWSVHNGAIVASAIEEPGILRLVINDLLTQQPRWLYCRLARIPTSTATDCPGLAVAGSRLHGELCPSGSSVVIALPPSWQEYRQSLSKAHKKNMSRRVNGMNRFGRVRVRRIGLERDVDREGVEILLRDAESVSRNSWQHRTGEGWAISDTHTGDFFFQVSRRLANSGMLDLSVLYLDDRPLSFIWGCGRYPHTTITKLGFDKSAANLGPGFVHLALHIQDSIERGMKDIDFGHEYAEYKQGWGKSSYTLHNVFLYRQGIAGRILRTFRAAHRAVFRLRRLAEDITTSPP